MARGARREARGLSSFRLPHSALRVGISLTEVLIALGILTIGLLGVAAVFPVGSWYMQKATVADQGSAIAQSVMNDAVTRGFLNPNSWYVMLPYPSRSSTFGTWNTAFQCDGKYCPNPAGINGTFTRPFAAALAEAIAQPGAAGDRTMVNKQLGAAYVIDPIGVAALAAPASSVFYNPFANPFPSSMNQFGSIATTLYSPAWQSWGMNPSNTWPIRRATIQQADGWQMSQSLANTLCSGTDDLATELPKRDDRPAMQNWDVYKPTPASASLPMSRQWAGDFSWMLTVLPITTAARDGMASNPEGHEYQVSVVVFHKRSLPSSFPGNNAEASNNSALERGVRAKVLTTGPNGGELLLEKLNGDGITESPFSQLRVGNWIMLCGPHPNSSNTNPKFVLNWYQVLSIDKEGTGIQPALNPNTQCVVALRGTQWPWQPATSLAVNSELSNGLCVAICKGVVAVHTKSLRLENPRGGVFGNGMSLVTQNGGTDPNYRP